MDENHTDLDPPEVSILNNKLSKYYSDDELSLMKLRQLRNKTTSCETLSEKSFEDSYCGGVYGAYSIASIPFLVLRQSVAKEQKGAKCL